MCGVGGAGFLRCSFVASPPLMIDTARLPFVVSLSPPKFYEGAV